MHKRIIAVLFVLMSLTAFGGELTNRYVELIAEKTVETFKSPYGIPQIFEETIDTSGYSEIRMFINVFAEDYKKNPVTDKSKVEVNLFHPVQGSSWSYAKKEIRSEVSSYINGWFEEKIIGTTTRIVAFAHDLPKGPYTVTVTYYLVK